MDSSNPQCGPLASLRSNRKRKSNTPRMGKSKKAKFLDTYIPQSFSLPDPIMHYIAKNPSTAEVYKKMIQTCKYFFVKLHVLVISRLLHYCDHWRVDNKRKPLDLNKVKHKFWITDKFHIGPKDLKSGIVVNQNISIPQLYHCDAKICAFVNRGTSLNDLPFLIESADDISLVRSTVEDKNGENVGIEKIVEAAVKAKIIIFEKPTVTSKTIEELIKIPHFSKLDEFVMQDIHEVFDLEAFYDYLKKNKLTKFWLSFDDSISDAYKNRLNRIVDKILATKVFDYKPPYIYFNDMDDKKFKKLNRLYRRH